jgi:hypothetical protein
LHWDKQRPTQNNVHVNKVSSVDVEVLRQALLAMTEAVAAAGEVIAKGIEERTKLLQNGKR